MIENGKSLLSVKTRSGFPERKDFGNFRFSNDTDAVESGLQKSAMVQTRHIEQKIVEHTLKNVARPFAYPAKL